MMLELEPDPEIYFQFLVIPDPDLDLVKGRIITTYKGVMTLALDSGPGSDPVKNGIVTPLESTDRPISALFPRRLSPVPF